jgi:hypothetical protein
MIVIPAVSDALAALEAVIYDSVGKKSFDVLVCFESVFILHSVCADV